VHRWYVLTIIDLFLHEGRLKATYAYIIFYFFIACFRFAADILILSGTHRVVSMQVYHRLKLPRVPKMPSLWFLFGEFIVVVLAIAALYHVGSLFAHASLWLQVADPSLVGVVERRQDKFDAAFAILTFLFTLFMLAGAGISFWCYHKEDGKVPEVCVQLDPIGVGIANIITTSCSLQQASFGIAAVGLLWIRSFSEIIIVLRYHLLRYPTPAKTPVARDTIYGLCTFAFLVLISTAVKDMAKEHGKNPLLARMQDDTRNSVIARIEAELSARKPAPALANVFEDMRDNLDAVLVPQTRQELLARDPDERDVLRERHRDYLDLLERKYGNYVSEDRSRET
jgi:hypothetical protein